MGSDCPKADKPGSVSAAPAPLQRDVGTNFMPLSLQRSCQLKARRDFAGQDDYVSRI